MTTCWTLLPDVVSGLLSTHLQLTVTQQKIRDNQKTYCVLESAATSVRCLDSLHSIPCCSECSLLLRARLQILDSHTVMVSFHPSDVEPGSIPVSMAEDYRVFTHYFITPTSTMFIISTWPFFLLLSDVLLMYSPNSCWQVICFQALLKFSF